MNVQRTSARVPPPTPGQSQLWRQVQFQAWAGSSGPFQPRFQYFKGWEFHSLSGLCSMLNHSHCEEFYPSAWSNFPCFNMCPLTATSKNNLCFPTQVSSWPMLHFFSAFGLHQPQILFKALLVTLTAVLAKMILPHFVRSSVLCLFVFYN